MVALPPLFLKRFEKIVPSQHLLPALKSFACVKLPSVRVNTLKIQTKEALDTFHSYHIALEKVSWYPDAFILKEATREELERTKLLEKGFIFIQSFSSMLPVLILDPKPGEAVLDTCAAPGGKTSQMAALMENKGKILAVEAIRKRYFKLKSVLSLLGVTIASLKCMDARRLKSEGEFFDKILVDAPCSSEGRFSTHDKKSFAYWSLRKIKEMVRKQKGLLMAASRLLKRGGIMVYSTCTFAPEENEGVIDWLLKKTKDELEIVPIQLPEIPFYPAVEEWNAKRYDKRVQHALRVLPAETMEGFFIAKFIKK